MFGGRHFASTRGWALGLCRGGLIAIKDPGVTCQWANWGGEMWGFGEDCCGGWFRKVFLGRSLTASSRKGRAGRFSHGECRCVRMECLQNSRGLSELHLPSFECQPICYPPKSNLLEAHLKNILMLSKTKWQGLSRRELSKKFSTLNGWPILW